MACSGSCVVLETTVQFSEGFSVSLQFPVSADSQFPLFDLPSNLVLEFFCVVLTGNYTN